MAYFRKIPEDPAKPGGRAKAWEVEVVTGRTSEGRKIRSTRTFRTRAEAEDWAKSEEEKARGVAGALEPSKESLAQYLIRWLDSVAQHQVRPRTFAGYKGTLTRYIIEPPEGAPGLGRVRLDRLTSSQIQEHYSWLKKERGLSATNVRIHHAVLRTALNHAVRIGVLRVNPAADKRVVLPKAERKEIRPMTAEEATRFLEAAQGARYFALGCVLLTGGLRPGEAYGLKWGDLDGDRVRRTLTRTGVKGWKLMPPKTDGARRTVVLPDLAVKALADHRRTQAEERLKAGPKYEDHGLIFATPRGAPVEHQNLTRRHFLPVLREAGLGTTEGDRRNARFLPRFRMYDLRHTCATLLLLTGEHPKVVSERLGHATITLTLDTYSHVLPSMQEGSAGKLQALLSPENRSGEGTSGA